MLCFISWGRAHECEQGNQWTCSMWMSTWLFPFVSDFLICGGRISVWEMSRHHAVLQMQGMEGTGWCPCTKCEIGLYLHLFCFRPYSLKFIKTGMFPLAEAKSLLFGSQMRKSGGHQPSRTPKAHVKIFVCLRFIQRISGVSWKREHVVAGWDIHDSSFLEVPPPCCGKALTH